MSRSPELSEILERLREATMADVRVAMPAKVVRWDAATQQVDCQVLIKNAYSDEDDVRQVESLPVVPSVPVVYPGGGGFTVTFPLSVGDTVLLIFADQSIDKWLAVGGMVDPEDERRHALSDAIAIPGLRPLSNPLTTAPSACVRIGQDGGSYDGVVLGTALKNYLDSHCHTDPATGVTGTPCNSMGVPVSAPAGSATVKATP